jgi:hypothetical protein
MDANGRLERRTKLDLVAYGVSSEDQPRDPGGRRKRRARRSR